MMKFLSILASVAVLGAAAPAAAQHRPQPVPRSQSRNSAASALAARIASLNARIAMLRDEGAISREQALDLRDQSRGLTRRLNGMSARDLRDLEFGLDRVESGVRYALDDARWGRHVFGDEDNGSRHVDTGRERTGSDKYYEHFDRYTGSSVDRWHDPFDRGDNH